jgi:hypothetical protein
MRDQIKAARAKETMDEKNAPSERPWGNGRGSGAPPLARSELLGGIATGAS